MFIFEMKRFNFFLIVLSICNFLIFYFIYFFLRNSFDTSF